MNDEVIRGLTGILSNIMDLHHLHECTSGPSSSCFPDMYGDCTIVGRCDECEQIHPCQTRQLIVGAP